MKADRLEGLLVDLDGLKEEVKSHKYKAYEGTNFLNRVFQSDQLQINAFLLQGEDFKQSFYNIIRAIETNPDAMVNPVYLKAYTQHLQIISQLASTLKGGSASKPVKQQQGGFSLNYLTDSASLEQMRCTPRDNTREENSDDDEFGSFQGEDAGTEPGDLLDRQAPIHHPHTHRLHNNGVTAEVNLAEIVIPMADTSKVMEKLLHEQEQINKASPLPKFTNFQNPREKPKVKAPPPAAPKPEQPQSLKLPFVMRDQHLHKPQDIWKINFDEGGQAVPQQPKPQQSAILDLPTLPILLPYIPGTISLQPVNLHEEKPVDLNQLISIDKEEFTKKDEAKGEQKQEDQDEFQFVDAVVEGAEDVPQPVQKQNIQELKVTQPEPMPIKPKISIFDLELDPDPVIVPEPEPEIKKVQSVKKVQEDLFDFSVPEKVQTLEEFQKAHPPPPPPLVEQPQTFMPSEPVQQIVPQQPKQFIPEIQQPQPVPQVKKITNVFDMDDEQWGVSSNPAPQLDLHIHIPTMGNNSQVKKAQIVPLPPTNISFDSLQITVGPSFEPEQAESPKKMQQQMPNPIQIGTGSKSIEQGDQFGDFAQESAQQVTIPQPPLAPPADSSQDFAYTLPINSIKTIGPTIQELPTTTTKKTDQDDDDEFEFAQPAQQTIPDKIPEVIPTPIYAPSPIQTSPNLNGLRGRIAGPSKHLPQVSLNESIQTSVYEQYMPQPSIREHISPIAQSQMFHQQPHYNPPTPVSIPQNSNPMFHSQIRLAKKVHVLEGLEVNLRDDWRKVFAINKWECNAKFYKELRDELDDLELWAEVDEIAQELKKVEEITQLSENYSKIVEEDEEQEVASMVKLMQNKILELRRDRTRMIADQCVARNGLSISAELSNKIIDELPEYEEMFKRIIKSIKNPVKRQQSFLQLCLISVVFRNTLTQKCKAFKSAIQRVIKQSETFKSKLQQMQDLEPQQLTKVTESQQFKAETAAMQKIYATCNRLYQIVKIYEGQSNLKFRLGKVKTDLNNLYTSINCRAGIDLPLIAEAVTIILLQPYFKPYLQALNTGQFFRREYIRACEICLTGEHTHPQCKALLGL